MNKKPDKTAHPITEPELESERKPIRILGDVDKDRKDMRPSRELHPRELHQRHQELSDRGEKELSKAVPVSTEILQTIRNELYFVGDVVAQFTEADTFRNVKPTLERIEAIRDTISDILNVVPAGGYREAGIDD